VQDPSVEKLFREQLDYYVRRDQSAGASPIISLFLEWTKNRGKRQLSVGEFGGSAGQLLEKLEKEFPNIRLTNVEIVSGYRKHQVSKKIKFVEGSILDNHFQNSSFDCLIIRDVLHHLIGKNYQESLANQKKALEELWRLLKPGGAIFIEELVNCSALAGRLIYWFSKVNSKIGMRSKFFQISPYTILVFLTPQALLDLAKKIFGKRSIKKVNFVPAKSRWQFRIVHLGARYGKIFLVVEKI